MKKLLTISVILLSVTVGYSQKMDTTIRLSVQAGFGWTHYYNNLVIGRDAVHGDFAGTSLRLMWEPEHRLSLGIETGYYKLYRVTLDTKTGDNANLSIVPVMANLRMRIMPEFYVTAGTGIVLMYSDFYDPTNNVHSMVISYSNVQVSGLYLHHLTTQFAIGAEAKFMWIDKSNDFMSAVQGVVSWRF